MEAKNRAENRYKDFTRTIRKQKKISIIIVNYNGKKFLKGCLESIYKQTIPKSSTEIIIIDNNSKDGSAEFIEKNYPDILLIKNKENVGHSKACNQGAMVSTGQYLLFLDNDVFLEKNFIEELIKVFHLKKDCGVAGGMVKDMGTNFIQEMGINIDYFGYPISDIGSMFGYLVEDKNQFSEIFETFYVSSCALMIPKKLFLKVGGFDEKYFMYKDDLDLCWRVQLLGYKVYVNPKAKIYHKMGVALGGSFSSIIGKKSYVTTVKKRYFGERNTIRTLLKNYSWPILAVIIPLYLVSNIFEILFFMIKGQNIAKAYIDAWIWNIKEIRDTLERRYKIQKIRKVSDFEIMKRMYKGLGKLKVYRSLKNIEVK